MCLEESPSYPTTLIVSSLPEDTEKYKDTVGVYNIVPGEKYNDRPVWKHSKTDLRVFNHGKI